MGRALRLPHLLVQASLARERLVFELKRFERSTARHIEGSSRLSERDGAGAIMLAVADTVVANGLSKLFSNNGAASNFPINSTFTFNWSESPVAIAWSHKIPAGSTMTQPTTDLDLTIKHPNGNELAKSML